MIITAVALILFIVLVGVTLLGGRLRRLLSEEQLSEEFKDRTKLALGLVGCCGTSDPKGVRVMRMI